MKAEHFVSICRQLIINPSATQRQLAAAGAISLGLVNNTIKESVAAGYLRQENGKGLVLTEAGQAYLNNFRVKNAIFLAAGFGMRCLPLTSDIPKGLLEMYGKPLMERQIEQLHEKGITEIIIVVGYQKERFDYLIDKYGVKLVYNPEYANKNNLTSLYCVRDFLENSYILLSDTWYEENIFNVYEARSWISCTYHEGPSGEWCITASPSDKVESIYLGGKDTWIWVGATFVTASFSERLKEYLCEYYRRPGTSDFFWDQIVLENLESLPMHMNKQTGNVHEFDTFEELKQFDPNCVSGSKNRVIESIMEVFKIPEEKIENVYPIKEGLTNDSFKFSVDNIPYVFRIPGKKTEELVNRKYEYAVYQALSPYKISDDMVYISPDNGYKITVFIENARVCDPLNFVEVKKCMKKLRDFHNLKIKVAHKADIFEGIEYYEKLMGGQSHTSCFRDYDATRADIMKIREYVNSLDIEMSLVHGDANPNNFLITEKDGAEDIRLIDWEYAGMYDPHSDIATFAMFSMYDTKEQVNQLIDCYFDEGCTDEIRIKIYAYMSAYGLFCSNWCEFNQQVRGIEFGEYMSIQYRYAKEYYRIFAEAYGRKG